MILINTKIQYMLYSYQMNFDNDDGTDNQKKIVFLWLVSWNLQISIELKITMAPCENYVHSSRVGNFREEGCSDLGNCWSPTTWYMKMEWEEQGTEILKGWIRVPVLVLKTHGILGKSQPQ